MKKYIPLHQDEMKLKDILANIGIDLTAEGFIRTPERFLNVMSRFTTGYSMEVKLERTYTENSSMNIEPNIPFVSLCEHHLMPFFGHVSIAYIPNAKKVTGLSKLDQLVEKYSLRFQIQERMGNQIADEIQKVVKPLGTAVIIKAVHTCKLVEGCQATRYITSAIRGVFIDEPHAKTELMMLLNSEK